MNAHNMEKQFPVAHLWQTAEKLDYLPAFFRDLFATIGNLGPKGVPNVRLHLGENLRVNSPGPSTQKISVDPEKIGSPW